MLKLKALRFSFISLMLAAMLAIAAPLAMAATTVFVGTAGCNGLTPCFNTIQAGVNNAGGGPATVYIFPNTYAESVDISLMGSADGGPANLTLQAVNIFGLPAVGTVLVSPAVGEAFWNSVDPFGFDLTINGINVSSGSTDAIDIEGINGQVSFSDMEASGAVFDGIDIRGNASVTLTRVNADGNGNDGIQIRLEDSGNVIIRDSTARNNETDPDPGNEDDDGIVIQINDGFVQLTNLVVTGNGDDGIRIRPWNNVPLMGNPSVIDEDNIDFGTISSISLYNVVSSNNGDPTDEQGDGVNIRNTFFFEWNDGNQDQSATIFGNIGNIDIRFSSADDNGDDGFQLEGTTNGNVTILDTVARRNGADGYEVNSGEAPDPDETDEFGDFTTAVLQQLSMIRSQAIDNQDEGFQLESEDGIDSRELVMNIILTDTLASGNGQDDGDGYELAAVQSVTLTRVSAINNGEDGSSDDGIEIGSDTNANYTPQTIVAQDIIAIGNAADNLEFEAFGNITLRSVIAQDASTPNDQHDNIELSTWDGGDILLEDCLVTGSSGDGIDIDAKAGGSITVRRCNAIGNGQDGIDTQKSNPTTGVINAGSGQNTAVVISDVFVQGNGDDGIQVSSLGPVSITRACVQEQTETGFFVMATGTGMTISNSVADTNGIDGFRLRDLAGATLSIDNSNINGNTPGVFNEFAGNVSASNNWWGAASGPTDPANGGGSGDLIQDGDNGAAGMVSFTPFLIAPAPFASTCAPVAFNQPAEPIPPRSPVIPPPVPPGPANQPTEIPSLNPIGIGLLLVLLLLVSATTWRRR